MINEDMGRTWKNAPSIVRDARLLAWLGLIGGFFGICCLIGGLAFGGLAQLGVTFIVEMLILSLFFPLYIWLLGALKKGVPAAYKVQMIMSIIGLLSIPIGTLINGYILYKWFRPETKAWFGV